MLKSLLAWQLQLNLSILSERHLHHVIGEYVAYFSHVPIERRHHGSLGIWSLGGYTTIFDGLLEQKNGC